MINREDKEAMNDTDKAWTIQQADWRDYVPLNAIERVCFSPQDIWPFWDLIGALTLPGLVRLKAVVEGSMVGFIGGERESGRRIGWVTTLAVLPAFRRKGIAVSLLTACEKELGTPRIRLSVRASNEAAIRLYESEGYGLIDRWKKYYTGGEDGLVFEKKR